MTWRTALPADPLEAATSGVRSSLMVAMSLTSMATNFTDSGIFSGSICLPIFSAVAMLMSCEGTLATVDSKSATSKIRTVPGPYCPVCMASTNTAYEYPSMTGRTSSPPIASAKQSTSSMPIALMSSETFSPTESSLIIGLPRPTTAMRPFRAIVPHGAWPPHLKRCFRRPLRATRAMFL